ncbi:hypothetical protein [Psychrilyobacter piezotolerans]|uniref:Uncharacterized protein n=2 Tax=Fusobacteriaceae TaxID=203492 RepID=A0ABX9KIY5_9FUSO|nr:hypothetical protein [Psychrilyobacter piezotolerans]MCS5422201.1 hypothetical protein [Psychrilyobacter sp. S5]RDE64144.1 hypothetical protein DV867_04235 [Psychrilyobacter sp. S5]REI42236.1 hypothetical protein DYH56_04235 [Psychrilyobacter piezotolerans]
MKDKEAKNRNSINSILKNHSILDIKILLGALKNTIRIDNFSREARRAITSALEIEREKMVGNICNFNEITSKLQYPKIKKKPTESIEKEIQNTHHRPTKFDGP